DGVERGVGVARVKDVPHLVYPPDVVRELLRRLLFVLELPRVSGVVVLEANLFVGRYDEVVVVQVGRLLSGAGGPARKTFCGYSSASSFGLTNNSTRPAPSRPLPH